MSMQTEAEAVKKTCPILLTIRSVGDVSMTAPAKCVGSDCMMWRWHSFSTKPDPSRLGYCGIAEKPVYAR